MQAEEEASRQGILPLFIGLARPMDGTILAYGRDFPPQRGKHTSPILREYLVLADFRSLPKFPLALTLCCEGIGTPNMLLMMMSAWGSNSIPSFSDAVLLRLVARARFRLWFSAHPLRTASHFRNQLWTARNQLWRVLLVVLCSISASESVPALLLG